MFSEKPNRTLLFVKEFYLQKCCIIFILFSSFKVFHTKNMKSSYFTPIMALFDEFLLSSG
jgi:hypothetical protein